MAEEPKVGRGRPVGSTKAGGFKRPGSPAMPASSPLSATEANQARAAIPTIVQNRELMEELITEIYKPGNRNLIEHHPRLVTEPIRLVRENDEFWTDIAMKQREAADSLLTVVGHREEGRTQAQRA
jgi:hypothetical protein